MKLTSVLCVLNMLLCTWIIVVIFPRLLPLGDSLMVKKEMAALNCLFTLSICLLDSSLLFCFVLICFSDNTHAIRSEWEVMIHSKLWDSNYQLFTPLEMVMGTASTLPFFYFSHSFTFSYPKNVETWHKHSILTKVALWEFELKLGAWG